VMADRVTIISPRDPWPFSTVTASDLEDLVGEGLLRPLTDEQRPEWIPPMGGAAPSPPPGFIVSFVSFHERGFGVPAVTPQVLPWLKLTLALEAVITRGKGLGQHIRTWRSNANKVANGMRSITLILTHSPPWIRGEKNPRPLLNPSSPKP
jgi:hypothetical protein